jgi:hypothetical protein
MMSVDSRLINRSIGQSFDRSIVLPREIWCLDEKRRLGWAPLYKTVGSAWLEFMYYRRLCYVWALRG